jgi:membrane protein YqaA with SNARE-associated domain
MHEIFVAMNEFFKALGVQGLALNSFIESFFLVPPPDFLLIALDLAKPDKALFYALVCTVASVLGAAVGYGIGYWGGRPAFNFIFRKNKDKFEAVEKLYNQYGVVAVFFSAFTPIPYKVFTIASGVLNMNFWQFILASFVGRGARFFLVSIVLMLFGAWVKQYLELIIIAVSLLIVIFFVVLYKKRKSFIKPQD